MKIIPVILCGGTGTRLWPLSREQHPKQFVDLGDGRTLFKDTLARVANLENTGKTIAVCNEAHRFFVKEELREMNMDGLCILEPAPRNTAPAIALAAHALKEQRDVLMLVMPADHYLENNDNFNKVIQKAASFAESGKIVVFGVKPDSPNTGYGYIRVKNPSDPVCEIVEFIEKPDKTRADILYRDPSCFWNAGMFLMRPDVLLAELEKNAPKIALACKKAMPEPFTSSIASRETTIIRPDEREFLNSPEDSIDYAVMEKTRNAVMVPLLNKWSDLGSWEAFFHRSEKDEHNNVTHGDVIMDNVSNCYLHSCGRLIAAVGVDNTMVVETKDAVIIADRKEGQKIKDVVASLKKSGRYHYKQHPLVYKPWGSYEILAIGDRFQVKRLVVNPGESLSLQFHYHRAEHWVIVSGTAEITLDDKKEIFIENQSVYIPIGSRHRVLNPGKIPLIMIEVQSGGYLEEDDIVRIQDGYGRAVNDGSQKWRPDFGKSDADSGKTAL